ncbi:hypothetical protein ACGFIX_26835 [Nocardia salmonicida]|uniref:hypothetical protein n=1 Tax=Nocardia salmonicida TaxID=53431 RepID=UPI00370FBEEA
MPRQALPVGTYGKIKSTRQRNGSWRATTRYRDEDGISRPVDRFGTTKGQAENALRRALAERTNSRGKLITRDTTLTELADLWLAEKAVQDGITPQSLDLYRREIDVSTDKRAKPDAIKIKSSLGGLRVWEASTSRLDAHIKRIALDGHREKARRQRVILSEMMGMAVRHDAIDRNPSEKWQTYPASTPNPAPPISRFSTSCASTSTSGLTAPHSTGHLGTPTDPNATNGSSMSSMSNSGPARVQEKRLVRRRSQGHATADHLLRNHRSHQGQRPDPPATNEIQLRLSHRVDPAVCRRDPASGASRSQSQRAGFGLPEP